MRLGTSLKSGGATGPFGGHATLGDGLVSYWKLDEASGTRVDSHGSSDLTDNNTVGSTAGKKDNAAFFVAANSESLSRTGITLSASFTWSAWIKVNGDTGNDEGVFSVSDAWPNQVQCSLRTALSQMIAHVGSGSAAVEAAGAPGATALNDGNYHLLIVTFTDADQKVRLYTDNAEVSGSPSAALGASHYSASSLLEFGKQAALVHYDGGIDESGLWSRVLTSQERTDLWNSGAGRFY